MTTIAITDSPTEIAQTLSATETYECQAFGSELRIFQYRAGPGPGFADPADWTNVRDRNPRWPYKSYPDGERFELSITDNRDRIQVWCPDGQTGAIIAD